MRASVAARKPPSTGAIQTNLQQLVIALQGHTGIAQSCVRTGLFLKEPKSLHVGQIAQWRRSVTLWLG